MININDSPPKLSQDTYETVLLLPTYVGVEVLRVEASDPDTTSDLTPDADRPSTPPLVYSVVESSVENFSVDRSSGTVTVINPNLNKELYQFTVKVGSTGLLAGGGNRAHGVHTPHTGLLCVMEGLQVSDPPQGYFYLAVIKKCNACSFFPHVKFPTLL